MRRNISSELIVALLAAVSLLFAAVFAVLLSTSTSQIPTYSADCGNSGDSDVDHYRCNCCGPLNADRDAGPRRRHTTYQFESETPDAPADCCD